MTYVFYISAVVAVVATLLVVTRTHAVHSLLYLVVSLLAVAMVFAALGAPLAAALEVIVYAGAIIVLFVFVVMMLNLGKHSAERERAWLAPSAWAGPTVLCLVLMAELLYVMACGGGAAAAEAAAVGPKQVGEALFGPYVIGVELAGMLLLAGLVGACHLGRREALGEGAGEGPP
jgi:NADH-quinone oxidoreductase subunit J